MLRSTTDPKFRGEFKSLDLDYIQLPKGYPYRQIDQDNVRALILNIEARGQSTPIEVEPLDDEGKAFALITGLHRYEAMKRLRNRNLPDGDTRFNHIIAYVFNQPLEVEDRKQLMYVENVTRKNYTQEQQFDQFRRWREVHPRKRSMKGDRGLSRNDPMSRSNEQAAREFGVSIQTIGLWDEKIRAESDPAKAQQLEERRQKKTQQREVVREITKKISQVAGTKPVRSQPEPRSNPEKVGDVAGSQTKIPESSSATSSTSSEATSSTSSVANNGRIGDGRIDYDGDVLGAFHGLASVLLDPMFTAIAEPLIRVLPADKFRVLVHVVAGEHKRRLDEIKRDLKQETATGQAEGANQPDPAA